MSIINKRSSHFAKCFEDIARSDEDTEKKIPGSSMLKSSDVSWEVRICHGEIAMAAILIMAYLVGLHQAFCKKLS